MHAWSAATPGRRRHGRRRDAPDARRRSATAPDSRAGCATVKGKFVLVGMPQPTCRPDSDIKTGRTRDASHASPCATA